VLSSRRHARLARLRREAEVRGAQGGGLFNYSPSFLESNIQKPSLRTHLQICHSNAELDIIFANLAEVAQRGCNPNNVWNRNLDCCNKRILDQISHRKLF
jgi:hypothetical protein